MPRFNVPVQNVKYRYRGDTGDNSALIPDNYFTQDLEVGKELFGPKSFGLSSAEHIFTRVEDGHFMEEIYSTNDSLQISMRANALFVVDKDGFLRQIGLENKDGEINITVSNPVGEFELPPRPTFWTRVKSFFGNKAAREQVKAYNDAKEFNDDFKALVNNEKYEIKPAPARAEEPAAEGPEVKEPEVKGPEVKEPEVNQNQQEMQNTVVNEVQKEKPKMEPIVKMGSDGKIAPERLRLNTFKDMVGRSWQRAQPNAIEVLLEPGASPEENYDKYYEVIANTLKSQLNRIIWNKGNQLRNDQVAQDNFYWEEMEKYPNLEEGVRQYVRDKIDINLVKAAYESGSNLSESAGNLLREEMMLSFGWVEDFTKLLEEGVYPRKENAKNLAEEEVVKEEPAQTEVKAVQEKRFDLKSPEEFRKEIEALDKQNSAVVLKTDFLEKANATVDDYHNTLTKMLLVEAAHQLVGRAGKLDEAGKTAFYGEQQEFYRSMEQGLREFVPTQVSRQNAEKAIGVSSVKSRRMYVTDEADTLMRNGLKNYHESVQAQNAANKPQQQMQLNQPQVQQVQSQPQAPAKGIPG